LSGSFSLNKSNLTVPHAGATASAGNV
jgi:hypothetical protein